MKLLLAGKVIVIHLLAYLLLEMERGQAQGWQSSGDPWICHKTPMHISHSADRQYCADSSAEK